MFQTTNQRMILIQDDSLSSCFPLNSLNPTELIPNPLNILRCSALQAPGLLPVEPGLPIENHMFLDKKILNGVDYIVLTNKNKGLKQCI